MKHLATEESGGSGAVVERLRERMENEGPLPWPEVMSCALYEPGMGYYSRGVLRVGRTGDFYTSVSVGATYGHLLAQLAQLLWEAAGRPETFVIAEQAAHDGQLAADVWDGLKSLPVGRVAFWQIVEPQPVYRAAQERRLEPLLGGRVQWLQNVRELNGTGLLLCNELLDALPVNRVRWSGSGWENLLVEWKEDGFAWTSRPSTDPETAFLPTDVPAGWVTETHGAMVQWAEALGRSSWQGAVLISDYGYDAEEYHRPERPDGTLRRYTRHGTDGKVLEDLGNCDLTAHIDFTRLRNVLMAGGFQALADLPQGRFLTSVGMDWLRSLETLPMTERMARVRQFQALTHPGHMGAAFRMMLMGRGLTRSFTLPTLAP